MITTALAASGIFSGALAFADSNSLWRRDCGDNNGPQTCILSQSLLDADQQSLAIVRIALRDEEAIFQLLLPEGVHLGSGVFYTLDAGPEWRLEYLRCRNGLCEASRALSAQEWRAMRRAQDLSILYRSSAGEAPTELSVSLMGITAAAKGDKG